MANYIISPNMNLVLPTPGQDPAPDYANNQNSSGLLIDSHNHTQGKGVPIPTSGLNINADLPFAGFNATNLRSARFTPQGSPLALAPDLGCVYVSGVDLWFNDGNGNQIQLTAGGLVNATSSGIASGTATASFSAGVLVVNANVTTPANIRGGSILLGNNVANSKFLTLAPPSSMAANYSLTLPSLPTGQSFMTVDASGNIIGYALVAAGLTGSNLAAGTVTRQNQVAVGQQISSTCGIASFSGGSSGIVDGTVTNLSVTITTTGRPVMVMLMPYADNSGLPSSCLSGVGTNASAQIKLGIANDGTVISWLDLNHNTVLGTSTTNVNWTNDISHSILDTPAAGTYTYTVNYLLGPVSLLTVSEFVLVAYEL